MLALAACGSEPTDPDGAGDPSSGGAGGDGGGAGGRSAPESCPAGPYPASDPAVLSVGVVSGQLVDERGEPTTAGLVQACGKDVCYDITVGQDGQFVKDVGGDMLEPACKFGDGRAWGKLLVPIAPGDTDLGTLTAVALPDFGEGVTLAAGETVTSGAVTLRLAGDAVVEIDDLSYEDESEWGFRAAEVKGDALAQLGQDFVAAYALAPLETVICPSPALSIANDAGLAAGTELELFVLGLDVFEEWAPYAGWHKVGEGQVSPDEASLEFPEGVPVLTAIGIREKP